MEQCLLSFVVQDFSTYPNCEDNRKTFCNMQCTNLPFLEKINWISLCFQNELKLRKKEWGEKDQSVSIEITGTVRIMQIIVNLIFKMSGLLYDLYIPKFLKRVYKKVNEGQEGIAVSFAGRGLR